MKRISILAIAAFVSFGLVGCVKDATDNNGATGGELVLRIGEKTRTVEAPGATTEGTIQVSSGTVFMANAAGTIVKTASLVYADAKSAAGQTITGVPADVQYVYIVANTSVSGSPATLDALKTKVVKQIADVTNYAAVPLANKGNEVAIVPGETAEDASTVAVVLSPLVSRVELASVEAKDAADGTQITAFTVAGVYLDSYFSEYTLAGVPVGDRYDAGSNPSGFQIKDEGTWAASGSPLAAVAGAGTVWAHNVVAGATPRFVVKLTNVAAKSGTGTVLNEITPVGETTPVALADATFYLSMSATNPYTGLDAFVRGKIYKLAKLQFSSANLFTVPNPENRPDLTITVSVEEWITQDVTGNI